MFNINNQETGSSIHSKNIIVLVKYALLLLVNMTKLCLSVYCNSV